jgi:FkbM family methyltransferase
MFFSEYGQDAFVSGLIPKRNGVFVEFGALDGLLHSNSLYFEREHGWTGLLIEANPDLYWEIVINRPNSNCLNAAIYDRPGTVEFQKIDGGLYGWSGIREAIEPEHWIRIAANVPKARQSIVEVPCMTLEHALDIHGITDIDYLSIDVEGAELKILSGFPFNKYKIDVIGVEDNFGNPVLDDLLTSNGFKFLQKVGPDRMYRANPI